MRRTISRRSLTTGSLAALIATPLISGRPIAAQEDGLASLDLPTMDIAVTADGFGGVPGEIEAGRYLVTITPDEGIGASGAAFVQPTEGLSADQLLLELQSATEVTTQDVTTPETTTQVMVFPAGAPMVAYDATFAGGVMGLVGGTQGQAVLDLTPGGWVLWAGSPSALQTPLILQVTGEMPEDLPEPEADIDATLSDGSISVDGSLSAGDHILRITHEGEEPHRIQIMRGPDDMSEDQIQAILLGLVEGAATPEALPFDPNTELESIVSAADQSNGTVQWLPVTLEAGTHVALCLFPMQEDSTPHAMHGEYRVFSVE